ncbi:MAG TPA: response regulator transcription factor [Acetobacteraceae bacterium]|nr:response regulator transcription factor [Acetobacteraceae bacterium]
MISKPRILLIDEDPAIQRAVRSYLEQYNMNTVTAYERRDVLRHFGVSEPNVAILDLQLSRMDGFALLREIRSRSDVPVIVAARRDRDDVDWVVGLELGADQYLGKPFGLRELVARIRAMLRRQKVSHAAIPRPPDCRGWQFGGWLLDRRSRRLTDPNGVPVTLTKSEYALLVAFLSAPRRLLSREHILQATHVHKDISGRSVDVQVLRLRRKLEPDMGAARMIETERGLGYALAVRVERF